MRLKEGFILRRIASTDMIVPIGDNIADFNGVISLNETAAFLLNLLKEGSEIPIMSEALIMEYDISKEKASEDVERFVEQLKQSKMLEDQ